MFFISELFERNFRILTSVVTFCYIYKFSQEKALLERRADKRGEYTNRIIKLKIDSVPGFQKI